MASRILPRCRTCGGVLPGDGPAHEVCKCGTAAEAWQVPVGPFGLVDRTELDRPEWMVLQHLLVCRSGMLCEARTPACLVAAARGSLAGLPRWQISIHHRRGRKNGGTSRPDVHTLANLLLVCGHGTIGCHWWIGHNPDAAAARGLIVPEGVMNPSAVPLELGSGRRVQLDPVNPLYLPPSDGLPYAV